MNHKSTIIGCLFLAIFSISGHHISAQSIDGIKEKTYLAYVRGELGLWGEAISEAEKVCDIYPGDSSLYEYLLVQYGYVAYCVSENHKKEGQAMIQKAYKNIEKLDLSFAESPSVIAVKAAFLAFEMNLSPSKMVKLGPEANRLTDLAYNADNNNLMAVSGKANQLNFTPKLFGGSKTEAIPLYLKTIYLFEKRPALSKKDWRYINTLLSLAQTYEKKKMYLEACSIYEKIISSDNNISWVNNKLYPECQKKAKTSSNN